MTWGRAVLLRRLIFSAAVLFFGQFPTVGRAVPPGDLYPTGPASAAAIPSTRNGNNQGQPQPLEAKKASEAEKNGKDELDMLDLNLKELSQVAVKSTASPAMSEPISTVSRTESTVGKTPSAVYVLTNEMIRRSGARNLPEALRLVPGVEVAQVTQTTWAISIRGFNSVFANKLLVQIDGRAVYTPSFGNVLWDMQQVLLDDVERIEVIRGPGATVWGANAVNGVINIITKSSTETHGILAYSGGGNQHRSFNAVRTGGQQGDLNWRVYGMQADDGTGYTTMPIGAWDAMQFAQGGFRLDWKPGSRDTLTLQGDFLGENESFLDSDMATWWPDPAVIRTTDFLGRWSRRLSEERDWSVQLSYYNWYKFANGQSTLLENETTFDLDSQYHVKLGDRHDVVCGFGYRSYDFRLDGQGGTYALVPPSSTFDIISYFAQDTIELQPDRLFLTAGSKLEHNSFTNFEYQPSIRLLIVPEERTCLWGAISRAVRTPSFGERDGVIVGGFAIGDRNVRSEDMLAYELGVRRQPTDRFYWDLAAFFNRYDNLVALSPLFPPFPPYVGSNIGAGDTYGYELVATYTMSDAWHLSGAYTFLIEDIGYGPYGWPYVGMPGANPRNQFFVRSAWDLSEATHLDVIGRYVDNLPVGVPHYFVMDIRLAHEFKNGLEAAIVGQNLLENHHLEFRELLMPSTEVPSGVYGMLTWRH